MVDRWVADTNLSNRFPLYTRGNVGEVFPDPVTPIGIDSLLTAAEQGFRKALVRVGAFDAAELAADGFEQLGVVEGYCYLNASVFRVFGERAPGLTWQAVDAQMFGERAGTPPHIARPEDDRPDLTARIAATFEWALSVRSLYELIELTEDRAWSRRLRRERPDLTALTEQQLLERCGTLLARHEELYARHLFNTHVASLPLGIVSAACARLGRAELVPTLIAAVGHVDSVAPSLALWDLGRMVAASSDLTALFGDGVVGLPERLRACRSAAAEEFRAAFSAFTFEFGSRGPNEWELRSPTWETRPELALAAIDRMRLSGDDDAPARQQARSAAERDAAAAWLLDALAAEPGVQAEVADALRAARVWFAARERSKTNSIRVVHEMRLAMREIGRRMVARGFLREVDDFAFLRWSEYPTFLADPAAMVGLVQERHAQYRRLAAKEPPFVFLGTPPDPSTWPTRDRSCLRTLRAGNVLRGIAGSPGVAEGRARVVHDSDDPSALEPGDILVAPITDPSWTPLFVPSAAVIVDVGAALSHAVTVSRELGIPCVVSVTNATRLIPNGARVRVDGNAGTVTLLSA